MIEVEKKFTLTKEQKEHIELSTKFVAKKEIIDIYFDNNTFDLTKNDIWLRQRHGQFEIKVSKNRNLNRKTDQYAEIENENEIRQFLKINEEGSLLEDIKKAGFSPFAELKSIRLKYQDGPLMIDIDDVTATNFHYMLAEIELMVEDSSKTDEAAEKILEFAKSKGLQPEAYTRGKVIEYIRQKRPEHFEALVRVGVVK